MSDTQEAIMAILRTEGPKSSSELTDALETSRAKISRATKSLSRFGMIRQCGVRVVEPRRGRSLDRIWEAVE